MQKHEKKEVAGGASCKWLKVKGQICRGGDEMLQYALPIQVTPGSLRKSGFFAPTTREGAEY
jgi:hypothetical protein